jgi:hypothetical protein
LPGGATHQLRNHGIVFCIAGTGSAPAGMTLITAGMTIRRIRAAFVSRRSNCAGRGIGSRGWGSVAAVLEMKPRRRKIAHDIRKFFSARCCAAGRWIGILSHGAGMFRGESSARRGVLDVRHAQRAIGSAGRLLRLAWKESRSLRMEFSPVRRRPGLAGRKSRAPNPPERTHFSASFAMNKSSNPTVRKAS